MTYTTDAELGGGAAVPPPSTSALSAETDAMRLEADALGVPDTLEGLLAFALREVAGLRIAAREAREESDGLRAECAVATAALGHHVEALASEVARLKLRVKKLEGEL